MNVSAMCPEVPWRRHPPRGHGALRIAADAGNKRPDFLYHARHNPPRLTPEVFMFIAIALHLLAAVIWVGGMFFAYMALRPVAATLLEPPLRLPLWSQTFARFFPWVWTAVLVLPLTGYWMIFHVFGGFAFVGLHVHLMHAIGLVMIAIFLHVYFAPYRRMNRAIAAADFPAAGKNLGQIRRMIGINLILGLTTVVIAALSGGLNDWIRTGSQLLSP